MGFLDDPDQRAMLMGIGAGLLAQQGSRRPAAAQMGDALLHGMQYQGEAAKNRLINTRNQIDAAQLPFMQMQAQGMADYYGMQPDGQQQPQMTANVPMAPAPTGPGVPTLTPAAQAAAVPQGQQPVSFGQTPSQQTAQPGGQMTPYEMLAEANRIRSNPKVAFAPNELVRAKALEEGARAGLAPMTEPAPGGGVQVMPGAVEAMSKLNPRDAKDQLIKMGPATYRNVTTGETIFDPDAYQREKELQATGAPRTSVNVGAPSFTFPRPETEKAADTAFGKGMGEMAGKLVMDAPKRAKDMQTIDATEKLLDRMVTAGKDPGKFAELKNELARSYYAATGQKVPENVQDFRTFSSLVNRDVLNFIGSDNGGIPASGFSDKDMAMVKTLAASAGDDPLTVSAKLAVKRASLKADDAFAKDVMDLRKQYPTEVATYMAMENAKIRDVLSEEPAIKRWAQSQGAATPALPGMQPAQPQAPVVKKWKLQDGSLVPE